MTIVPKEKKNQSHKNVNQINGHLYKGEMIIHVEIALKINEEITWILSNSHDTQAPHW